MRGSDNLEKITLTQSDYMFDGEEQETIREAAREMISVILNKHLTYAEAVVALAECKVLIEGRQLI